MIYELKQAIYEATKMIELIRQEVNLLPESPHDLTEEQAQKIRRKANSLYGNDDVEIDDDARISEVDGGYWVQAVVWVPKPKAVENEEETNNG